MKSVYAKEGWQLCGKIDYVLGSRILDWPINQLDWNYLILFEEHIYSIFIFQNDSCVVNISVTNVNEWEPRFRYPQYEFFVGNTPTEHIGRIEAADGDKNEKLKLTLSGLNASLFYITTTGDLKLRSRNTNSKSMV